MNDNINIKAGGDAAVATGNSQVKIVKDQKTIQNRNFSNTGTVSESSVVVGDNNTVNYKKTELPPSETVDIQQVISELKVILSKLDAPDQKKINRAFEDVTDELDKSEPDKDEIGTALERALKYSKHVGKFKTIINTLQPHVTGAAAWLGSNWNHLLEFVGLSE